MDAGERYSAIALDCLQRFLVLTELLNIDDIDKMSAQLRASAWGDDVLSVDFVDEDFEREFLVAAQVYLRKLKAYLLAQGYLGHTPRRDEMDHVNNVGA